MQDAAVELRGGTLIDPANRRVLSDTSIYLADGKIAAIGAEPPGLPAVATVIDCSGQYILPGLIDAHVHVRPTAGAILPHPSDGPAAAAAPVTAPACIPRLHSYLYCGVTSIFDAGNDPAVILALRRDERSGDLQGPRIFCTGRLITVKGGHAAELGMEIDGDTDIDGAVADHHREDQPDLVKITYDEHNWAMRPLIPILSTDQLARIIGAVHDLGSRVIVHTSNELRSREAIAAGADVLAHPVIQSPITDEFAHLVADRQIPIVSTLAIGQRSWRMADHPEFVMESLYAECEAEPERIRLVTEESARQRLSPTANWFRIMTPVGQENLRRVHAAGGVVVTGTDLSFGPDLHREMEILQDAGIPPLEVIRCATHNAARALGKESELGVLDPGAEGDLLITSANPLQDIRNLSRITHVVQKGRLIDRALLDVPARGPRTS